MCALIRAGLDCHTQRSDDRRQGGGGQITFYFIFYDSPWPAQRCASAHWVCPVCPMALIKMLKRKMPEEKVRNFQPDWTDEFAFVESTGNAICLLCNAKIASMK